MKIRYSLICLGLLSLFFTSCKDGYEYYDGLYVSWTLGNTPVYNMLIDAEFPKTIDLTVASSEQVGEDITIELRTDPSLVAEFNKKYNTNYEPVPDNTYVLTDPTVMIEKGSFSTTKPVRFNVLSKDGFQIGRNYMMPITITKVSGGYDVIEASRTVYVALTEVIVRPAVDFGSSGYVGTRFSKTPAKQHGYDLTKLTQFTFEARINMHSYRSGSFNGIMGLEENFVLRSSSYDGAGGRLEVAGGGMTFISNNEPFPLKAWTHVAVSYSGDDSGAGTVTIFLNGQQQIAVDVQRDETRKYINLIRRYNGTTWDEDANFMIGENVSGRYINSVVSEARVWAKALTPAEIRSNMCAVDPESEGLIGYWYFDEMGGTTFKDATGHGYDMVRLAGTLSFIEGVRCPE